MSSLKPGCETNVGLTYKLLQEVNSGASVSIYYEAGLQWRDWKDGFHVMTGRGINRQIRRAYGALASRYRPGDRIFLLGYSRGAYAVRSLAGVIDRVGLLKPEFATVRHIRQAYRYYQDTPDSPYADEFAAAFCHTQTEIEMVGVWDTVKALGLRLPVLWRFADRRHAFHNHQLGSSIKHGFHALALDENRVAYTPVLWECPDDWTGHMEQVWFRGCHGDVGGQLNGFESARPLANIPLSWMLEKLAACEIELPIAWRDRFPQDIEAPSAGNWRGWGMFFLSRRRRRVGNDKSERLFGAVHDVPQDAAPKPIDPPLPVD
jgi:uncharacterized protein (DUF2235 family)